MARTTAGFATGALRPLSGGEVAFAATRVQGQIVGTLAYQKGAERYVAVFVSAFAVEAGARTAWLAGVGIDGRTFLAYAEDHGLSGDVFRLWIGGVEKTGDGRLASGGLTVSH